MRSRHIFGMAALLACMTFGALPVYAAISFADARSGLPAVTHGALAWADYDNDGDPDVVVTGLDATSIPITRVYRNNGSGTLTDAGLNLPGVSYGAVAWGYADNDYLLDLIVMGSGRFGQPITRLYRNVGNGILTDSGQNFPGLILGGVAWGDYDVDGDSENLDYDLAITGQGNDLQPVTTIFRNNGGGYFTDTGINLPDVAHSTVGFADYTGDGFVELTLTGQLSSGQWINEMYLNDGPGYVTYRELGPPRAEPGWSYGRIAPADPDLDGDLDMLFMAQGLPDGRTAILYENNGIGSFTDRGDEFPHIGYDAAAWGDYDVDTRPDLLLTGSATTRLYHNDSDGGFTDSARNFVGLTDGAAGWADYDGDGLSDILVAGQATAGATTILYRNNSSSPLRHQPAPFPRLREMSTAWGDYDNDGRLDLALSGTDESGSVSALYRNAGNGSFVASGVTLPAISGGALAWGDYNGDGRLDLVLGGDGPTGKTTTLLRNTVSGTFVDSGVVLLGLIGGAGAWGDYNNDGRLDLLLTGRYRTGPMSTAPTTKLYRNTGTGLVNSGLSFVALDGSMAWADYNGDGHLDFALTGVDSSRVYRTVIYRNRGNGTFANSGLVLPGVTAGGMAWADYNGDGSVDLALTGYNPAGTFTRVYRNTGSGFTDLGGTFQAVHGSSVAWGDYDTDGRLDLLVTGQLDDGTATTVSDGRGLVLTRLYRNLGSSFADSKVILPGLYFGAASWADYDADRRLDALLVGNRYYYSPINRLFRNATAKVNTVPAAPSGLNATPSTGSVILNWTASSDTQTAVGGLSYNVRVGTTPGGNQIRPSLAASSGLRRLPGLVNTQPRLTMTLTGLQSGSTYYWSVQAIDSSFGSSAFAAEKSFIVP